MTEFDLMISGQLYNAEVPQLQAMRRRAAELCHRLELLSPGRDLADKQGGRPDKRGAQYNIFKDFHDSFFLHFPVRYSQ